MSNFNFKIHSQHENLNTQFLDEVFALLTLGWEPPKKTKEKLVSWANILRENERPTESEESSLYWSWKNFGCESLSWPDGSESIIVYWRKSPVYEINSRNGIEINGPERARNIVRENFPQTKTRKD